MTMPLSCPEDQDLAGFVAGVLSPPESRRIEDHLALCDSCRKTAGYAFPQEPDASADPRRVARKVLELMPAVGKAPLAVRRHRPWGVVAAAAVLLAVAGYRGYRDRPSEKPVSFAFPRLEPGPERQGPGTVQLADGTVLALGADARVRLADLLPGERVHLELSQGTLEARVPKGSGLFRIVSPAGEVHVLGTHFRVKAFSLGVPGDSQRAPSPAAVVELYEGRLLLKRPEGEIPLSPGERGLMVPGRSPARQGLGNDWKAIVAQYHEAYRTGKPDGMLFLAATFWGADWGPGWDWRQALRVPISEDLQIGLVRLIRQGSPQGATEELQSLLRTTPFERVRQVIKDTVSGE